MTPLRSILILASFLFVNPSALMAQASKVKSTRNTNLAANSGRSYQTGIPSVSASKSFIQQNGRPSGTGIDVTPYLGTRNLIGIEGGVMGAYRILPKGFLPMLNNSVAVETGLHRSQWSLLGIDHNMFATTCNVRWSIHLSQKWSSYVGSGLAFKRSWFSGDEEADSEFDLTHKIGAMVHFNQNVAMRFEYSPDMNSLRIGSAFLL